tara:strand:+ start:222 stop:569 length:348 start_codon:yes stop_codon:yes gene_type:complete
MSSIGEKIKEHLGECEKDTIPFKQLFKIIIILYGEGPYPDSEEEYKRKKHISWNDLVTKLDELLTEDYRIQAMALDQLGGGIHVIYNINTYDISVYGDPEETLSTIQEAVPPKKF